MAQRAIVLTVMVYNNERTQIKQGVKVHRAGSGDPGQQLPCGDLQTGSFCVAAMCDSKKLT